MIGFKKHCARCDNLFIQTGGFCKLCEPCIKKAVHLGRLKAVRKLKKMGKIGPGKKKRGGTYY